MKASTKIATCYNPGLPPGSARCLEIRRDNTTCRANQHGRFVVTEVHNGIAVHSTRRRVEQWALEYAAVLGFTDVLRAEGN